MAQRTACLRHSLGSPGASISRSRTKCSLLSFWRQRLGRVWFDATDRSGRLANQNFTRGRASLPEQRRWLTIVPNQDHWAGGAPEPATAATSILVSAGLRIPGHFASNSSVRSCPVWKRNGTPRSARRAATGSTVPVQRATSSIAAPSAPRVHPRQSDRDRAPPPLLRLTRSPDRTR